MTKRIQKTHKIIYLTEKNTEKIKQKKKKEKKEKK